MPGIGPLTADKILQMRKSYGVCKRVDDLLAIKGIGPKRLAKMCKYLVAGKSLPKGNLASQNAASPKSPAKVEPSSPTKQP